MKQTGIMLKMAEDKLSIGEADHPVSEQHIGFSPDTPLRKDAFDLTDEQQINTISGHTKEIMNTLGLDLEDDSLKGTPGRVAKMFVKEIFSGIYPLVRSLGCQRLSSTITSA